MKKFIFLFAASFILTVGVNNAQVCGCAAPLGDYGSINVAGWTVGQTAAITTCQWGGERSIIYNTVPGAVYRVSTCGASYDTQIEIYTTGCTWIAYNDDNGPACTGLNASVDFTSPGGNLYSRMSQYSCATNNSTCVTVNITLLSLPPCASDVTPPSFTGTTVVDQQALANNTCMAAFWQNGAAQSFIPTQNTSCGASIQLSSNGAGSGNITIGLYNNLPSLGGVLLASGTATGVLDGTWANVAWPTVSVTPGATYYLVFTGTNTNHCIAGDLYNGYAGGMVYANSTYDSFSSYDYTFKEFSCSGGGGCPSNIVVNAPSGSCNSTVTYTTPNASDNCSTPTVNQTSGLASGASYPYGVTTNTFVATDASGNSAVCSFTVTVNDVTAPVPNVGSLPTVTGQCSATVTAPTATDNCAGTITGTTGSPTSYSTEGTYTITWTYNDGHGNTTTQNQTVIVDDNIAPVPNVGSLPTITGQCSATVTAPTATDNCSGTITGTTGSPLTYSTEGTYNITWTYNDGHGNTSTQNQTVIVDDNIAPVPNVGSLPTITGQCSATVTAPTATDNCSGTITGTTGSPLTYSTEGTYNITWTYNDGHGNTSTQNQTVIVDDNIAPVPNTGSLPAVTGQCNASVSAPTATDNCSGVITGTTTDPTSYSSEGTYTVTWTYNDGHGNTTTQTQSVVVDDNIAPVPNTGSLPTVTGQCNASASTPTATDNCAGTITATTSDPTSYSTQGTYTITWNYNDGHGNTSSQTQTVIVDDNTAPVPNVASLPPVSDPCSVTLTAPNANDNCAGTINATTTDPTSYTNQGTYTVTWTYNDGNGNTVTQSQTVTITDNVAPVPNSGSLSTVTGQCTVNVTPPTATDNCAGTVTATTTDPTTYSVQGSYTVTWTYDDGHGNTTTQTQGVIVTDSTAPVPDNASLSPANGQCNITLTPPTATDNCAGTITATTTDPITYSAQGTYTVTWVYNDGNGNSTSQVQTVNVDDTTPPVPSVPALPGVTGSCGVTVPAPTANDNCSGTITGTTTDPLTYNAVGSYTITWSYNDGNGNTSTQTQSVIVNDNSDPVPNDANIDTSAVCTITLTAPTATDNCEGTITGTTTSPLTLGPGTHTVTWIYDDGNGNIFTQIQNVNVSGCAGIDEYDNNVISLYPNPSNGVFTLSLEHPLGDHVKVEMMNAQGQVLYTGVLNAQIQQFDFSQLAAGTYYLRLITSSDVFTKTVIIKQQK